jgi:hypothetical protein
MCYAAEIDDQEISEALQQDKFFTWSDLVNIGVHFNPVDELLSEIKYPNSYYSRRDLSGRDEL